MAVGGPPRPPPAHSRLQPIQPLRKGSRRFTDADEHDGAYDTAVATTPYSSAPRTDQPPASVAVDIRPDERWWSERARDDAGGGVVRQSRRMRENVGRGGGDAAVRIHRAAADLDELDGDGYVRISRGNGDQWRKRASARDFGRGNNADGEQLDDRSGRRREDNKFDNPRWDERESERGHSFERGRLPEQERADSWGEDSRAQFRGGGDWNVHERRDSWREEDWDDERRRWHGREQDGSIDRFGASGRNGGRGGDLDPEPERLPSERDGERGFRRGRDGRWKEEDSVQTLEAGQGYENEGYGQDHDYEEAQDYDYDDDERFRRSERDGRSNIDTERSPPRPPSYGRTDRPPSRGADRPRSRGSVTPRPPSRGSPPRPPSGLRPPSAPAEQEGAREMGRQSRDRSRDRSPLRRDRSRNDDLSFFGQGQADTEREQRHSGQWSRFGRRSRRNQPPLQRFEEDRDDMSSVDRERYYNQDSSFYRDREGRERDREESWATDEDGYRSNRGSTAHSTRRFSEERRFRGSQRMSTRARPQERLEKKTEPKEATESFTTCFDGLVCMNAHWMCCFFGGVLFLLVSLGLMFMQRELKDTRTASDSDYEGAWEFVEEDPFQVLWGIGFFFTGAMFCLCGLSWIRNPDQQGCSGPSGGCMPDCGDCKCSCCEECRKPPPPGAPPMCAGCRDCCSGCCTSCSEGISSCFKSLSCPSCDCCSECRGPSVEGSFCPACDCKSFCPDFGDCKCTLPECSLPRCRCDCCPSCDGVAGCLKTAYKIACCQCKIEV